MISKTFLDPWTIFETKYQSSKILLSPLGFKILRQLLYVFWNSMEHAPINKTSKFETDFLEKKSVNNFCGFSIPLGDPSILCVLEFQRNFSEHFSMQTHSLEHIVYYALFRSHENLRIVSKVFSKTQKQFWVFYSKIFPSKVI